MEKERKSHEKSYSDLAESNELSIINLVDLNTCFIKAPFQFHYVQTCILFTYIHIHAQL